MTAPLPAPTPGQPAPEAQPAPVQPLAPPPDSLSAEEAVVALLAAYVAAQTLRSAAGAATRAALTPARLVAAIMRLGIPRSVARATLRLSLEAGIRVPRPPSGPGKAAQRAVARAEPIWRARYLLNAAKRMGRAYLDPPRRPGQRPPRLPATPDPLRPADAPGTSPAQWTPERMTPAEAARRAFERERRYLEQHRAAQANRRRAARAVDAAAARYGEVLGWVSVRDNRTTWDCLRLHGKNFHVADPPGGHLPGSVHPRCRCTAGPPHPGARIIGRTGA